MRKGTKKFLKLEYCRKNYGLTQAKMAELIGISECSYSHKETGRTPFSFNEIMAIYRVLNEKAKDAGHNPLSLDEIFLTSMLPNGNFEKEKARKNERITDF